MRTKFRPQELYAIGYLTAHGAVVYSKTYPTIEAAQKALAGMSTLGGMQYEIFSLTVIGERGG